MVKNIFLILLIIAVVALSSYTLYNKNNRNSEQAAEFITDNIKINFYGDQIEAPVILYEGVTYVPLQIMNNIGYNIRWDDDAKNTAVVAAEEDIATQVLKLVNEERIKRGITELRLSDELTEAAQKKARDMIENNYFDHYSPTYGSLVEMLERFGIKYEYAGENIASGHKTARDVMRGWMDSENHKKNILFENYGEIGIGYESGIWVQLFK